MMNKKYGISLSGLLCSYSLVEYQELKISMVMFTAQLIPRI